MDETHFQLIEKMFDQADKRSEERHNALVTRLDERFDTIDVRFSGQDARISENTRDIAALKEAAASKKGERDFRKALVGGVLGIVAAVCGAVSAIAAWMATFHNH